MGGWSCAVTAARRDRRAGRAVARWYWPGRRAKVEDTIAAGARAPALRPCSRRSARRRRRAREERPGGGRGEGVPAEVAGAHGLRAELAHAPDMVAVAAATDRSIEDVARLFFALGAELRLDWMERELARVRSATRMQRWAVQALREDASQARRALAIRAFTDAPGTEPVVAVESFLHEHALAVRRLDTLMRTLAREGDPDLAGLTLAVRQLRALVG